MTGFVTARHDLYGRYKLRWTTELDRLSDREGSILLGFKGTQNTLRGRPSTRIKFPERRTWSKLLFHPDGHRHQSPWHCTWPECDDRDDSDGCCSPPVEGFSLCAEHTTEYRRYWGVAPPSWCEMSLPVLFGEVRVDYIVENGAIWSHRDKAWVQEVRFPSLKTPAKSALAEIRSAFLADTGYRLQWLSEAIESSQTPAGAAG